MLTFEVEFSDVYLPLSRGHMIGPAGGVCDVDGDGAIVSICFDTYLKAGASHRTIDVPLDRDRCDTWEATVARAYADQIEIEYADEIKEGVNMLNSEDGGYGHLQHERL